MTALFRGFVPDAWFSEKNPRLLRDTVKKLIAETISASVFNLSGVTFIDSGGLGTLVALYTTAPQQRGDQTRQPDATRRRLAANTKLVTVFEVYDSEEQAVGSFHKSGSCLSLSAVAAAHSPAAFDSDPE